MTDLESFKSDMVSLIADGLPAQIAAITAEKGDGLLLPEFPESVFMDSITDNVINQNAFVYYGFENITASNIGANVSYDVEMFFLAHFCISHDNSDNMAKVLRLTRAMEQVITAAYKTRDRSQANIEVVPFAPFNMSLNGLSDHWKVGGVSIRTNFARS